MILLRDPSDADAVANPEVRALAAQRFTMLSEEESFDPDVMGFFIVVEPGDELSAINEQLGFDVLANRFTGIRFDQDGFHRSFEVLEEHRTCFEIVFVLSDDGYGVEVFVPKAEGIHPDLLAMCSTYATPATESPQS
jgi:hypothetical protein